MKKLTFCFAIFSFMIVSCTKRPIKNEILPPQPFFFEILDQNGQNMITSQKDTVLITYTDNSTIHLLHTSILKLYAFTTDTTVLSSKYNGLVVKDNMQMAAFGMQNNPVRNFNLILNGVNLGAIYLNYSKYLTVYPETSSSYFTFNNTPVVYDPIAGYIGVSLFIASVKKD